MPSTPMKLEEAVANAASGESSELRPQGARQAEGLSDTERPPAVHVETEHFGVEPSSGVAPAAPSRAPLQRPSTRKLTASSPSSPDVPPPPGAPAPAAAAPPPIPVRPSSAVTPQPPHGTTVGLAPPQSLPSWPDVPLTRRCTSCNERYPQDFLVCPRDATPLVDETGEAVDPLVGKLIGETYQIVRVVGEGGMGRVYEARHLRLKERRFAVKTLHADLARNAEMAARFLREAESASSISHPNVVDVFDVHHLPDGIPYFVGEFLEGEELADYVAKRGPLDPRLAADLCRQVCSALTAAHARGIVHRDMKPENIFVLGRSIEAVASGASKTLTAKVLDFGISKAGSGDNSQLTRTGVIMGTPSYMCPEQARGKQVDHRADVYSLGACLYFMVTGQRPFDSEDPTSTLSMVLTQDPVRPREIDATIPEMLELVIQRAMAKDVRDRYQSMDELDKVLAAFLAPIRTITSGQAIIPVPIDDAKASRSQRAFDVAKVMLGGSSMPAAAPANADMARAARPTIVIASAALGAWLVGGTVAALAGLVRVLHDGEITFTESVLLVVGCLFAAATPAALYVLHVRRVIWPNSVFALQLSTDLKRLATAAFVTYGAISIVTRISHTVLFRSSRSLGSGLWDITLFILSVVIALAIGGVGPLTRNLRRRRRA